MHVIQGVPSFDLENSKAPLLGFNHFGKYAASKTLNLIIKDEHGRPIDFMGDVLSFTLHLT